MSSDGQVDTGRITHLPQMHRDNSWKQPVRAATTANGTLTTAFDNASVIDGVTLATNDRILIKDQTAAEVNGIYIVQASGVPFRAYDFDEATEVVGAVVMVMEGTANAGKLFTCTNITDPDFETDDILWDEISTGGGGSALTVKDEGTPLATDATSLDFVGAGVTATGAGAGKTITIPAWAPTSVNYLVGTADAGLSAEIVVGTTPGGELGGTWASPTVDATHSGSAHPLTAAIPFIISGAGSVIGTGVAGDISVPFNCTVTAWRALADQSGSVAVGVWKDAYANYPPTVADLLLTATITTDTKAEATGLSHSLSAGDTLRYNVNSATTITRVTVSLSVTRT